jgi:nitrite reductase/ring-hydroxylating ferredoxin subunit
LSEAADADVILVDHAEFGPIVVVRSGAEVRAFRNLCPHQWLPLSYRSSNILSADGRRLRCSNHGAEFRVEDGRPLDAALPCGLEPVPVQVDGRGRVVLRQKVYDPTR